MDRIAFLNELAELLDWRALIYLCLTLSLIVIAKTVNNLTSGYNLNRELTIQDNKAVATSFTGFLFALYIILYAVLTSESTSEGVRADLKETALWAELACVLLISARIISDKVLLPKFSNRKELVHDRNIGVGAVQAGSYISTALIIKGLMMYETNHSVLVDIGYTTGWFILAQALFIVFAFFYQKGAKFCIHTELERDNAAVGVAFGGNLIAFSIILAFYLQYYNNILGLCIWALIAVIFLKLVRLITDKVILPKGCLDQELSLDNNWGAALIEAVTSIGAALILTGSLF